MHNDLYSMSPQIRQPNVASGRGPARSLTRASSPSSATIAPSERHCRVTPTTAQTPGGGGSRGSGARSGRLSQLTSRPGSCEANPCQGESPICKASSHHQGCRPTSVYCSLPVTSVPGTAGPSRHGMPLQPFHRGQAANHPSVFSTQKHCTAVKHHCLSVCLILSLRSASCVPTAQLRFKPQQRAAPSPDTRSTPGKVRNLVRTRKGQRRAQAPGSGAAGRCERNTPATLPGPRNHTPAVQQQVTDPKITPGKPEKEN